MARPSPVPRSPWSPREQALLVVAALLLALVIALAIALTRARDDADCWRRAFEDNETRAVDVCGAAPFHP